MIVLTHPKHGVKHCYAESEALADIANGWVRAVAANTTKPLDPVEPVEPAKPEVIATPRNKPGPKPKFRG